MAGLRTAMAALGFHGEAQPPAQTHNIGVHTQIRPASRDRGYNRHILL